MAFSAWMKQLNRLAVFAVILSLAPLAMAQEDIYRLAYEDIFGKLRRPAVDFDHEGHSAALEDEGCGACHHAPDKDTGRLVYVEDEEVSCSECHGADPDGEAPALRQAFHGSCNQCHRKRVKTVNNFKGPTTCGECHVPEKD